MFIGDILCWENSLQISIAHLYIQPTKAELTQYGVQFSINLRVVYRRTRSEVFLQHVVARKKNATAGELGRLHGRKFVSHRLSGESLLAFSSPLSFVSMVSGTQATCHG